MFIKTIAFIIAAITLCSCSSKKSYVVSFEYGGYDTAFALLNGEVFGENPIQGAKDSLIPLSNVTIKAADSAKKLYTTATTNSNGKFSMNFYVNDTFNLTVEKEDYQTIRITRYVADTGQISKVKIVLEKEHITF